MDHDSSSRIPRDWDNGALSQGRSLAWLRRLIHLRYVRAAVATLSVAIIGCSLGTTALEIRHQVSHRAVLRYFARHHLNERDLSQRLKNYATASRIGTLATHGRSVGGGGLVYAQGVELRFYPHDTATTLVSRSEHRENQAIFPRLAAAYYAADLVALLEEFDSPEVRARLSKKGVHPALLWHLKRRVRAQIDRPERFRLLRRAAELMRHFVPYSRPRYELPFPEKLRFYERLDPPGQFVGIYELAGIPLGGLDDSYGYEMSRQNHFITITTALDGAYVVTDFYRGTRREYSIRPFEHPSGATLYKVIERGSTAPALFPRLG